MQKIIGLTSYMKKSDTAREFRPNTENKQGKYPGNNQRRGYS